MLHTKICNKLCDFGLVCCHGTHMHACFKQCHINLSYYSCIFHVFWIITLAVPSSILYTITVEMDRTLLHSTQVNTCRNLVPSHFQMWIRIQKYNHWQRDSQTSMQNNMDFPLCHIKIQSSVSQTCRTMTEIRPRIQFLSDTCSIFQTNPDESIYYCFNWLYRPPQLSVFVTKSGWTIPPFSAC